MGEKAEKTKEKIRSEAYKLFAEKGFKEVTMTDICERTGLSRGGLYRHYAGTDEIFDEILSQEYEIEDRIRGGERAKAILEDMLAAMETEEFRQVDARQISDMILYYYQGLRMWSRVIPFMQETAANYSRTIRQLLYNE